MPLLDTLLITLMITPIFDAAADAATTPMPLVRHADADCYAMPPPPILRHADHARCFFAAARIRDAVERQRGR